MDFNIDKSVAHLKKRLDELLDRKLTNWRKKIAKCNTQQQSYLDELLRPELEKLEQYINEDVQNLRTRLEEYQRDLIEEPESFSAAEIKRIERDEIKEKVDDFIDTLRDYNNFIKDDIKVMSKQRTVQYTPKNSNVRTENDSTIHSDNYIGIGIFIGLILLLAYLNS